MGFSATKRGLKLNYRIATFSLESFGEPISLEDEEETDTRPLVRAVVTD